MKVSICDRGALLAVSSAALAAYARVSGWRREEPYGAHSDVYTGKGLPEIIIPRNEDLGDYATVVSTLIESFAEVAGQDEMTIYRDLVIADRDVIRVRAVDGDHSGSLSVGVGADLVCGARDLILAAACSLDNPRPLYRPSANREASDYLRRVRLGQTDQGSFVITLLSPAVTPPLQMALVPDTETFDEPMERRVTKRLIEALATVRRATDATNRGDRDAFAETVSAGVSANLCEALAALTEKLIKLDVSVAWARTYPRDEARCVVRFASHDTPTLRAAGRAFREREPQPGVTLVGLVQRLARGEADTAGTVTLRTSIDGGNQSVAAVLPQLDYHRAIHAHEAKEPVVMRGDLERAGQRWHLLNACVLDVISAEDAPERPTGFLGRDDASGRAFEED